MTYTYGEYPFSVQLKIIRAGADYQLVLTGGTHPHIGAICFGRNEASLTQFEGHKEGPLSLWLWNEVKTIKQGLVAVSVGIHVDDATKDMIALLVENAKKCTSQWLKSEKKLDTVIK